MTLPSKKAPQSVEARMTIEEVIANIIREQFEQLNIRQKRILSLEETAQYLGVSEGTIYNLEAQHKLTNVGLDRRKRFDIEDLDRLIRESKVN